MGVVARQSVKSIIIIFTGAVLGAAINYIYTFIFEKNELGLITNLTNQAVIVQSFVMMGAASVIVAYLPRYSYNEEKRRVLFTVTLLLPVISILLFTVLYAVYKQEVVNIYKPEDRPYIERYYFWLPVIVAGLGYASLFEYYLVSKMKAALGSLTREIILRTGTLVLIVLFFYRIIDFRLFVVLMSITYLLPTLTALILSIRSGGVHLSLNFKILSRQEYARLFHFSWYHLLEGVALNLLGYIDSLMLAPLADDGMSTLSVYRNALFMATIMVMPFRAVSTSSYPVLNQAYIDKAWEKLQSLYRRTNNNTFIMGLGMFLVIACNLDNAVRIFPPGYEELKPVTMILLCGKLIQMYAGVSSEVLSFSKYYKFNFRVSALLIIMVIALNRVLIPEYGTTGAAWSATISLVLFSLTKMVFLQRKLNLPLINREAGKIVVAGGIAFIAGWLPPFIHHAITDAIIRSVVTLTIYTVALIYLIPASDFSQYIKTIFREKRIF